MKEHGDQSGLPNSRGGRMWPRMRRAVIGVGAVGTTVAAVAAGWAQHNRPWWLALVFVFAVLGVLEIWSPVRHEAASLSIVDVVRRPTLVDLARARRTLLTQVRRTWIEGVLDRSLAEVTRVELGLATVPEAVIHPWGRLLQHSSAGDEVLPSGTGIATVATSFDGHLLILGAPGAGKTTLLLEYVRELLNDADRDPNALIPVVFHLSSWPIDQPSLARWMVDELRLRYGSSRRLASDLVHEDRLAVLMDGLDEVPEDRRTACVHKINAFRAEHGQVPLVVCSRSREYRELMAQLMLNGAVEVQPLDPVQVRQWLKLTGRHLAGLRSVLRDRQHWLWELLTSPLLLSISALIYQGQPAAAVRTDGSMETLLDAYVRTMLGRPRAPVAPQQEGLAYDDADTVRWLAWLAKQMGSETVFYPDWMQADWLPSRLKRQLVTRGLSAILRLIGALVGALIGLSVGWLFSPMGVTLYGRLISIKDYVIACALIGMLGGVMGDWNYHLAPIDPLRWSWKNVWYSRRNILLLIVTTVLTAVWKDTFGNALLDVLVGLLLGALVGILLGGIRWWFNFKPASPLEGIRVAGRNALLSVAFGVLCGVTFGVVVGVLEGGRQAGGLSDKLYIGLAAGLLGTGAIASFLCSYSGLRFGGATYIRHRVLFMLLRIDKLIPGDFIGFLDYADSRVLLRRAGGGYLFVHQLVQRHFAARAETRRREAVN
jgi:hypothetical protein